MSGGYAVVVGGANLDLVAASSERLVPATSNPGRMLVKPGGVGRNVAENIARLGSPVWLVAGIGDDPFGELVARTTREAGVRLHPLPAPATGTYTAMLDADGELVAAVSDMRAGDGTRPEHLADAAHLLADARLVVLDANPPADTLREAARLAGPVPVVVEPVSTPKARRLRVLLEEGVDWFAITPNTDELAALTGLAEAERAISWLHDRGVRHVWVRHGREGSVLHTAGSAPLRLEAPPARVVDVTGAGDAMLGAFVHALLGGHDVAVAAGWGHAAARLTIESEYTVRPDLTHDLLLSTLDPTTTPDHERARP